MKSSLYKVSAVCAILSVLTTVGIHSFIKGPADFEESLLVYKTAYYIFSKWWVIFHCLFVIISVYGLAYYLDENRSAFAKLGFTFYTAFGLFEILRMFMVLHYLGQLRDQYLSANDEQLKAVIKLSIDNVNGIGNMLFAAFTVAIILGNLFIGWACLRDQKNVRYFGIALMAWSGILVISLANESLNIGWINTFIGYFSLFIQPVIRLALGVILIRISKQDSLEKLAIR